MEDEMTSENRLRRAHRLLMAFYKAQGAAREYGKHVHQAFQQSDTQPNYYQATLKRQQELYAYVDRLHVASHKAICMAREEL